MKIKDHSDRHCEQSEAIPVLGVVIAFMFSISGLLRPAYAELAMTLVKNDNR